MKKSFVKMHGLGNDFAVFEGAAPTDFPVDKIRAMGDRHTGIGFDQMVVVGPPQKAGTDAYLSIYNNDGSEVGACGNATRCVAQLLMDKTGKQQAVIQTKSATLICDRLPDGIRADMGKVKLDWQDIPLSHENDTAAVPVFEGLMHLPVCVNVGNPHAVFFVADVAGIPLETVGPRIETNKLFPEKTNVEAVQVLDRHTLRMRVWERGAGITRACGTGACAAAVAAVRRGFTERKVRVILDGGDLHIEWRESDGHVLMTGPAAEVYRGEIEI